mgnify:CR=1 FL=1
MNAINEKKIQFFYDLQKEEMKKLFSDKELLEKLHLDDTKLPDITIKEYLNAIKSEANSIVQ